MAVFDRLFATPGSAPSRGVSNIAVRAAKSAADAVKDAELIIAAVTAASDLDAATSAASHFPPGAFYLDVNSVSPGMKRDCADLIEAAGGR